MSSQATAAYPHKQAYSSPLPTTVVALKDETRSTVSKASNAQPRQHALVQRTVDRWTVLPNLQDPKSYRRRDKVGIVFVVAIASFAGPYVGSLICLRNLLLTLNYDQFCLQLTPTCVPRSSERLEHPRHGRSTYE
jgi:hypothetical protein